MSQHFPTATAPQRVQDAWHTSGLIQLRRPQMVGTLSGLMLSVLLASLDQTIVGTAEPRIIASLSGFNRYPWVSTAYLLCSTICSIGIFVLGIGMFGVIIYLPLFMQGVLGVSATRSGSLLTPMLLGTVVGTLVSGQTTSRLRSYRIPSLAGSVIVSAGMILFARMDASTQRSAVLLAMIIAGFGMGLLIPVYTVAVQNVAPRKHMGAATASSTFFRSIGSTVGVAIYGSLLLTNYHHDFDRALPTGTPQEALSAFSNPLLLPHMRPQLEAIFSRYENGPHLLQALYGNVRTALLGGIQLIFLTSAILMICMIALNALLKDVPLRHGPAPSSEP